MPFMSEEKIRHRGNLPRRSMNPSVRRKIKLAEQGKNPHKKKKPSRATLNYWRIEVSPHLILALKRLWAQHEVRMDFKDFTTCIIKSYINSYEVRGEVYNRSLTFNWTESMLPESSSRRQIVVALTRTEVKRFDKWAEKFHFERKPLCLALLNMYLHDWEVRTLINKYESDRLQS